MHDLNLAILSFVLLFVIVDPIGLIPGFLAMTCQNSVVEKIRMARVASISAFFILVVFFFFGQYIFRLFGITLPAFQISGGILLMIVALDMLQARRTSIKESAEEKEAGAEKNDIAITPLAIPMLAGPGAITTVILLSRQAVSHSDRAILIMDLFLVCALTYLILRYAALRAKILSVIALKIITRIMGLILSAIAVQFILDGIKETFKTIPL